MDVIFRGLACENFAEVQRVITRRPKYVYFIDDASWTLFDHVIMCGKLDIAKYLWDMDGRPNLEIYCDGKNSPVHEAACYAVSDIFIDTLGWVLEKEILPRSVLNIKGRDGMTPIDCAIDYVNLKIAKYLWDMGGRPNLEIYCDWHNTPVHEAAHCEESAMMKWIFTEGVLPLSVLNIKDHKWGRTPFDIVISKKQWETVTFLGRFYLDPVFLAMQRAKRDYRQCVLRRLPNELLDMVVEEVAARLYLKVKW